MTLEETHNPMTDKRELAWIALTAIETHLRDHGYKLGDGAEDGIHKTLWDVLGNIEVEPT